MITLNTMSATRTYTSRQLMRVTIPAGFIAVNVARLGAKPRWQMKHDPARAVTCATCGTSNSAPVGSCWLCGIPLGGNHTRQGESK